MTFAFSFDPLVSTSVFQISVTFLNKQNREEVLIPFIRSLQRGPVVIKLFVMPNWTEHKIYGEKYDFSYFHAQFIELS